MRAVLALLLAFSLFGCNAERPDDLLTATRTYVAKESVPGVFNVVVDKQSGDFARLRVESTDGKTDPATVFMKRVDGKWSGVALGTGFPPADLRSLGIPEALWDMPAPESVVSDLYQAQSGEQGPFFQTTSRAPIDRFFDKPFADMIWNDAVAAQGEVGALDFDPLHHTQDDQITNFTIHPGQITGPTARVLVTFENYGTPEQITYSLVSRDGTWKIADLTYKDGTTLSGIYRANA